VTDRTQFVKEFAISGLSCPARSFKFMKTRAYTNTVIRRDAKAEISQLKLNKTM